MSFISNRGSARVPAASKSPTADATNGVYGASDFYVVVLTIEGDDTIAKDGAKVEFKGALQENFSISMGSNWTSAMQALGGGGDSGGGDGKVGAAIDLAKKAGAAAGVQAKTRIQSAQIWESSDPISFSIPFTFIALKDAKEEVKDRVRTLLKAAAPSEIMNGAVLRQPGPSVAGATTDTGRKISLRIGNWLLLDNCIIKRVEADVDVKPDKNGNYMSAKVNVQIESFFTCFTTQDIDAMFDMQPRPGALQILAGAE